LNDTKYSRCYFLWRHGDAFDGAHLSPPKPLVEIGGRPILWHIMKYYSRYGFNEFILALGYKGEMIKRYFLDFYTLRQDFTVGLENGQIRMINENHGEKWTVHLVDTGLETQTGGRLKRLTELLGKGAFMMTYGDGVCDVNLDDLLKFHKKQRPLVTLTAVRPPARFGALEFQGVKIDHFKEKSTLHESWINGGFFVIEQKALDYIQEDNVMWEHAPMETMAAAGKVCGYQHEGFWQCMYTARDLLFESLWETGQPPWKTW